MLKALKSMKNHSKVKSGKMREKHDFFTEGASPPEKRPSATEGNVQSKDPDETSYDTVYATVSDVSTQVAKPPINSNSGYVEMDTIDDVVFAFNAQYGLGIGSTQTITKKRASTPAATTVDQPEEYRQTLRLAEPKNKGDYGVMLTPDISSRGQSQSPTYMRAISLEVSGTNSKAIPQQPPHNTQPALTSTTSRGRHTAPVPRPRPAPRPLRQISTAGTVSTELPPTSPRVQIESLDTESPKHRRNSSARPRGDSGAPLSPCSGRQLSELPQARVSMTDEWQYEDANQPGPTGSTSTEPSRRRRSSVEDGPSVRRASSTMPSNTLTQTYTIPTPTMILNIQMDTTPSTLARAHTAQTMVPMATAAPTGGQAPTHTRPPTDGRSLRQTSTVGYGEPSRHPSRATLSHNTLRKISSEGVMRRGSNERRKYLDGPTMETSSCFRQFDTTLSRSHKRRVMDTLMRSQTVGDWFIRHDSTGCRFILVIKLVERLLHIPIEASADLMSFSIDEGWSFKSIEDLLYHYHHNNLSTSVPMPLRAPIGQPRSVVQADDSAEVDGYLVMARN